MNALARQGRTAVSNRVKKESDATCAAGRQKSRIGLPLRPARRRACGGPSQKNTNEKKATLSLRGARGALHSKATGRARAITAQTSTSRLSCHSIGGRRLVHHRRRHPRQAHHRKHIQATSRRRHPRQAHHRKQIQAASRRRHPRQAYHRLRPKKGSQPWREMPSLGKH